MEGKLKEIKEDILTTLIKIAEWSRRQDKQKRLEFFVIKVTDIVNTLPKAVQEVYYEHLFRHVRESSHREYYKVKLEFEPYSATAMLQTS